MVGDRGTDFRVKLSDQRLLPSRQQRSSFGFRGLGVEGLKGLGFRGLGV